MHGQLIHKEGPFSFVSQMDLKVEIQLPDGHGTGLTREELGQLARGARYVQRIFEQPIKTSSGVACRHRCRECDEAWSHDPTKLECVWLYDDLCGVCSGSETGKGKP